jgi:hypothetical protein
VRVDPEPGAHLLRSADHATEVEAFVSHAGGRVGLRGVLADLNRRATATRVPAPAAAWGFRLDRADVHSRRWWPQGITTSADAVVGQDDRSPTEAHGRDVVITSAYARVVDGVRRGVRLTVVDVTDPADLRYRHVLLVEPFLDQDGHLDVRPVKLHAGGIVWYGEHLHVAGTARGLASFRLADIVRTPAHESTRLRLRREGVDAFGYRYLLPLRFTYDARTLDGAQPLRYSFASVDRSRSPHELVVGEYGRGDMTTRLGRFPFDPSTSLLRADSHDAVRPVALEPGGVPRMQGATVVDGTWIVTASRGPFRLGSVWVGTPGELREHRRQLPVGPEDLTYWPARDQLWSLSEYPGARYVFAMPRDRFLAD